MGFIQRNVSNCKGLVSVPTSSTRFEELELSSKSRANMHYIEANPYLAASSRTHKYPSHSPNRVWLQRQ